MSIKKLIIGGIVGGIIFFLLGFLGYGIILENIRFFQTHHSLPVPRRVYRAETMMGYLALGNVLSGFFISYILLRSNVKKVLEGMITAGIVGLLVSASVDILSYSMTTMMSKKAVLVDVFTYTVIAAITGLVLTFIFSKMKSE